MKRIIIDTNALMAVGEFKVDIFSQLEETCDFPFELAVLRGTVEELSQIIKQQRGRYQREAKLALAILKAKKVKVIPEEGKVDDSLVQHSGEGDLVLTQDSSLKKKLSKPYLTLRQRKRIMLVK